MIAEDAPDSTPRNALVALSRRLRTVPAVDLPLVDRAVLLTIAGRADADWIAFPPVDWIAREAGTTINTVRRSLARLLASGWLGLHEAANYRQSARYKIRTEPGEPPPEGAQRHPSLAKPRGCEAHPVRVRSVTSEGAERDLRGCAAHPADHRKIPSRSQTDPTSHAREHTREDVQGDLHQPEPSKAVPFRPSEQPTGESFKLVPPAPLELVSPTVPARKSRRQGRPTSLPDGWGPSVDALAVGRGLGFDGPRVSQEADRFRDWTRARGRTYVDWHAAFANWLRGTSERERERGIKREPITVQEPRRAPPQSPRWKGPAPLPPPPPKEIDPMTLPATDEELAEIAEFNRKRADPEWRRTECERIEREHAARMARTTAPTVDA